MSDRVIVYPGAIPQEVDILNTNRFSMVGLGMLALDILGSGTTATGMACSATSPASLNVQIAPGRLYSLQNVDNTAYSTLTADASHQTLKQGILPDAITLGCAAPTTFGFSVNYLIQATYQDVDSGLVLLPYYNAANPAQALAGPGNSGSSQATVRKGSVVVQAKAGTAAATGSQTTPAPDAGYVGLWVVTVANGQTTITSANISMYTSAPFVSGTFQAVFSGLNGTVTATAKWWRLGSWVHLTVATATGTSNANTFGINNLPACIGAITQQFVALPSTCFRDNSAQQAGTAEISAQVGATSINFIYDNNAFGWTPSGGKGLLTQMTFGWLIA